jgi:aspartate kinase
MIVQSRARSADTANMEFTVGKRDAVRAVEIVRKAQAEIGFEDVAVNEDVAKVSVIGVGMRSHAGVAALMFKALAERGINIQAITTSEIKISVLIDAAYAELAVRTLHALYELDKD